MIVDETDKHYKNSIQMVDPMIESDDLVMNVIERREMKFMEREDKQSLLPDYKCNKNLNSFISSIFILTCALISVDGKCTFRRCPFIIYILQLRNAC